MPKFEITWQSKALNQLEDIEDYIAQFSTTAAHKVVDKILKSTSKLKSNPYVGQVEEFLIGKLFEYHYLVVANHKVIYRIENKTMYVIAVFDTHRNPLKMNQEV